MESLKELEKTDRRLTASAEDTGKLFESKVSYEEQREINRNISRLEKSIGQIERAISDLENRTEEMDKIMADPASANDPGVFERYDQLKASLKKLLDDWEKKNEEYEGLLQQKTW